MENLPISTYIQALAMGVYFNRQGLVHDCVFPLVRVAGCAFDYPDWIDQARKWAPALDAVTCHGDANEILPAEIELIHQKLADHALVINLTNCCDLDCNGNPLYDAERERTQELINTLLINREIEATNLVLNAAWDASVADPNDESSEGKSYTISPSDFIDQNFELGSFFDGIQSNNNLTNERNVAIIPQQLLRKMLRRQEFIGFGCDVPAKTTADAIAEQLGVQKICTPGQVYNAGTPEELDLTDIWPNDTILLAANRHISRTDRAVRTFGFSANSQTDSSGTRNDGDPSWLVNKWLEPRKGKGSGNQMLKIGHDETPIIADLNAGTLIQVTE